jgi:hypothetical protein
MASGFFNQPAPFNWPGVPFNDPQGFGAAEAQLGIGVQLTIYVNGKPLTFNSPGVTLLNPPPGSFQEAVQRVFNVLLVPLGSQILGRPYGLDTSWLDKPYNRKRQAAIAATVNAIQTWVPNISIKSVDLLPINNGVFNGCYLNVTLLFVPPNTANNAVFGPPGGTLITTVDMLNGSPAVVEETLTV